MDRKNVDWRALLREGALQLKNGHFAQAVLWFEAAHRQAPEEPLTCYALGRERMRQARYLEAEQLVRKAWQGDSSLLPAAFCLVRLLGLHLSRPAEAGRLLDEAAGKADHEDQKDVVHLLRGELALQSIDGCREAVESFGKVLGTGRRRAAAVEGLARAHNVEGIRLAQKGRTHEALFMLKKSSGLLPAWAAPRVNMGMVFQSMGKQDKAAREYGRALEVEPASATALFNLGKLHVQKGELDLAAGYYRRLLEYHPYYPGVRAALAELARRREELGETRLRD
jgi:tetratricopeptide (TPR) repeat protein